MSAQNSSYLDLLKKYQTLGMLFGYFIGHFSHFIYNMFFKQKV